MLEYNGTTVHIIVVVPIAIYYAGPCLNLTKDPHLAVQVQTVRVFCRITATAAWNSPTSRTIGGERASHAAYLAYFSQYSLLFLLWVHTSRRRAGNSNIGALMAGLVIRIGLWGILCYNCNDTTIILIIIRNPQNSIGNSYISLSSCSKVAKMPRPSGRSPANSAAWPRQH